MPIARCSQHLTLTPTQQTLLFVVSMLSLGRPSLLACAQLFTQELSVRALRRCASTRLRVSKWCTTTRARATCLLRLAWSTGTRARRCNTRCQRARRPRPTSSARAARAIPSVMAELWSLTLGQFRWSRTLLRFTPPSPRLLCPLYCQRRCQQDCPLPYQQWRQVTFQLLLQLWFLLLFPRLRRQTAIFATTLPYQTRRPTRPLVA